MRRSTIAIVCVLIGLAFAIALLHSEVRSHAEQERPSPKEPGVTRRMTFRNAPRLDADASAMIDGRAVALPPERGIATGLPGFPLLSGKALLAMLRATVENLDEAEISKHLQRLAGVDEEELKRRNGIDIRDFASRLLETAARDTALDEDGTREGQPEGEILFSSSPTPWNDPHRETREFAVTDIRIIAWIPAHVLERGENRVLVKWLDLSSGELEMFHYLYLGPVAEAGYRPVALRKIEGWSAGAYRVEVYRLDDEIALLATGGYEVVARVGEIATCTSSLELFEGDPQRGASPVDSLPAGRRSFFLGARVADTGGFTGYLVLRDESGSGEESIHDLRPAWDDSRWRVAEIRGREPLEPGLYTAELMLGGEMLEMMRFHVLDRVAK